MDPKLHDSPTTFNPTRYLTRPLSAAEYINIHDPNERDHFTYGAGRRVCPGIHVAERSLYINIVRTLWGFDICKALDKNGQPIEPDMAMEPGFFSVPERFEASIKPRSQKHAEVMKEALESAEKAGIMFGE